MKYPGLAAVFARIPLLAQRDPDDFRIQPLPGLTNDNYRLVAPGADWVLRVPRARTNEHIDRAAERHNQALAAGLGIAPLACWQDTSGLSLTPTLTGTRHPRARDFEDPAMLERMLAPIRSLHRSGCRFHGRVELVPLLERYYALLSEPLRQRFRQRLRAAHELLPRLVDRDADYVASHNDPIPQNLLLGERDCWLIDWEFSAMASPYWDLATLCNAAALDQRQSRELLLRYCAGTAPMEESLLFDYRNLLQLLDDCWMAALVQD